MSLSTPPPRELWLRALFDESPAPIGFSREGVTVAVNAAYLALFGCSSAEEMVGRSILEQIAPEARPAIIENIARRARSEFVPPVYETRGLRRDGSTFPFLVRVTRVVLQDGPLTIMTAMDLSSVERVEHQLRDALGFNHQLISASTVGILAYREDGACVLANEEAARTVGASRAELLAQNYREIPSWRASGLYDLAVDALASGEARERTISIHTTFHRDAWLAVRMSAFESKGERHLLVIGTDVTQQVATERALRDNEERLRLALEVTEQGLWDCDLTTGELFASPRFRALLGLDATAPLVARTVLAALDEDDVARVRALTRDATRDDFDLELRLKGPNGEPRWARARGAFLGRDSRGRRARLLGTIGDITQRKEAAAAQAQLEERLRQAQKMETLGILAGGVAHDFNNLLTCILGSADLAAVEVRPDSPTAERLATIANTALRAADRCKQMLIYAGRGTALGVPIDLRVIVGDISRIITAALSRKASLHIRTDEPVPSILADPTQLRQLVLNLAVNASEALGDRPGEVTITVGREHRSRASFADTIPGGEAEAGDYVYVEVADTGAGMDEETRQRMFDPFFSTKFTGRGLGMAVVLGVVRGHRGVLEVQTRLGVGTRVRALFPRAAAVAMPDATVAEHVITPWGHGTVLVVDDEEMAREVGAAMLTRLGFAVVEAANGLEAVQRYRPGGFRCVLLDLTMPVMDGVEALTHLRAADPTVKVILCSGHGDAEVRRIAADHRADAVLTKPFRFSTLSRALHEVLNDTDP